jgi:pentatricopeptide repeat protein
MAADALELYHRMPKELIVEKTHVCVLNACSHSGLVNEARAIFQNIPMKTEWDYTVMVCTKYFGLLRGSIDKYVDLDRLFEPVIFL